MAFVTVPKDLTKVKNKLIFNLTKRQIICFGIAAGRGAALLFPDQRAAGHQRRSHGHGHAHAARISFRNV